TLPTRFEEVEWRWIVAPDAKLAHQLFLTVADWNNEVHGEILVFEAGCFCKSKELNNDIASYQLDDLVLANDLGNAVRNGRKRFLDSKELYRKANAPWKRGMLLLGPPGNGKTHAVKGLIREAGLPCIYVKSFSGRRVDPHESIPSVFERARKLAPCLLVLEDLDAQIDESNRSVLLNELDGFARNEGLITLPTTNHPHPPHPTPPPPPPPSPPN